MALLLAVNEASSDVVKRLQQRCTKRVITCFSLDVRPRGHEVELDAKRRTLLLPVLEKHSGFVDLQESLDGLKFGTNQFDERGGWSVMDVLEQYFHGATILRAENILHNTKNHTNHSNK